MQFIVKRDILLKSLSFVQGVVEKKNTLPILSNVLIELEPILKMVSGSKLVLSGILDKDEKLIRQKYSWCNFKKARKIDGWLMLSGIIK